MQLTKFDHWLKQKFIYETHIFCLRLPENRFSRGVKVEALNVKKAGDHQYKLIIKKNQQVDGVIDLLEKEHIMYTTRVVNGKNILSKFIMPEGGKSFTYQLLGRLILVSAFCSFVFWVYKLSQNEELMLKLRSALKDLDV